VKAPPLAWIERWSLRAGLFLLPLGFSLDTYDQYVLPKLLVARALVLLLLLLFVTRIAISGQVTIKRTPLDLPLLAFVASAVLSTVVAENQNVAIFGTYGRYDGLLTLLTYVALFWLVVQTLHSTAEARSLLRVLLASGYVVAIIAILQSVNDTVRQGEVVPAFGSLGNPNVLGAFLAMVFALACRELVAAHLISTRILTINVLAIVGLALLLSFSRSGWLGAAVGTAIIVAVAARKRASRLSVAAGLAAILVAVLVVAAVAGRRLGGGFELERLLVARALTLFNLSTWGGSRLHIWVDSLRLIASRPLAGYGPDNFGLVFPRFQTGDWGLGARDVHQQIDKAHAETLQVMATQGLIGLAAYVWTAAAFVRSFWAGHRQEMSVGILAAFAAYQITIQLNFTALGSAVPFWIFTAAAIVSFEAERPRVSVIPWPRPARGVAIAVAAGLVAAAVPAVVNPYLADSQLRLAVNAEYAGDRNAAWMFAGRAAGLAPQESVNEVEVANVAIDRHDLAAARAAYLDAIRLGTYNPFVYRNLALVDIQLGLRAEALSAAQKAVELDRFDPANQALLAQLEAPS